LLSDRQSGLKAEAWTVFEERSMTNCRCELIHLVLLLLAATASAQSYDAQRERMVVQQIAGRGITDAAVLEAMGAVPRHLMVPENLRDIAYADRPIAIGFGQTISQPFIVAYMTEILDLEPGDRVLEVGTGSGYQAAVLAEIVDEVYTVEIIPELAYGAGQRLDSLGYKSVHTRESDGYFGWPEAAPFDAIVVTAAAEHIPPSLVDQLKDGGRMVIPVGTAFYTQSLLLVERERGETRTRNLMAVRFVPFTRGNVW
jgi:protein-L-isoaspartate(D-aspartate) O-methyltransferase